MFDRDGLFELVYVSPRRPLSVHFYILSAPSWFKGADVGESHDIHHHMGFVQTCFSPETQSFITTFSMNIVFFHIFPNFLDKTVFFSTIDQGEVYAVFYMVFIASSPCTSLSANTWELRTLYNANIGASLHFRHITVL